MYSTIRVAEAVDQIQGHFVHGVQNDQLLASDYDQHFYTVHFVHGFDETNQLQILRLDFCQTVAALRLGRENFVDFVRQLVARRFDRLAANADFQNDQQRKHGYCGRYQKFYNAFGIVIEHLFGQQDELFHRVDEEKRIQAVVRRASLRNLFKKQSKFTVKMDSVIDDANVGETRHTPNYIKDDGHLRLVAVREIRSYFPQQ